MPARIPCLLAALLLLSGCAWSTRGVKPVQPPPLDLRCDAGPIQCSGPCPALSRWETGRYEDLERAFLADTVAHAECSAKLEACQQCIQRGRDAGTIR